MVKVDVVARSVLVLVFFSFPNESPSLSKAKLHTKISYFANAHVGLDIFCLHIGMLNVLLLRAPVA